jgi:Rod binding domain-containing protein
MAMPALAANTGAAALGALAGNGGKVGATSRIGAAAGSGPTDANAKARATAVDFEAAFLSSMFGHMFTSIEGEGPFGGSAGIGVWRSFLSDEYGKSFAKSGGIGLADHVYRTLIAQQEAR